MNSNMVLLKKNIGKNLMIGIAPALLLMGFDFLMVSLWPKMKELMLAKLEMLNTNPIFQIFISGIATLGFATFESIFALMVFLLLDIVYIVLAVFFGTTIAREVERGMLDITLAYPIPRGKYLLEKYLSQIILAAFIPIFLFIGMIVSLLFVTEDFRLINFGIALILKWLLFCALLAIAYACSIRFLKPAHAVYSSGGIIAGMYLLERVGSIMETGNPLDVLSLFNYMDAAVVIKTGDIPVVDILIVVTVGLFALISAIYMFRRRELLA